MSRRRGGRPSRGDVDVVRVPIVCSHHQQGNSRVARLGTIEFWPQDGRVHVDTEDAFHGAEEPFFHGVNPLRPHLTWTFKCRKCGEARPVTNKTLELVVPFYVEHRLPQLDVCTVGTVAATLRKQ